MLECLTAHYHFGWFLRSHLVRWRVPIYFIFFFHANWHVTHFAVIQCQFRKSLVLSHALTMLYPLYASIVTTIIIIFLLNRSANDDCVTFLEANFFSVSFGGRSTTNRRKTTHTLWCVCVSEWCALCTFNFHFFFFHIYIFLIWLVYLCKFSGMTATARINSSSRDARIK